MSSREVQLFQFLRYCTRTRRVEPGAAQRSQVLYTSKRTVLDSLAIYQEAQCLASQNLELSGYGKSLSTLR